MTLLYLITAIFTMLSLVLSVRRVPRAVTVLQAVAFACAVIRLDTWAGNVPAVTLYRKNGFSLCGRAQVLFQGKIPEELVFLEYRCPPSADPPAVCGG